VKPCGEYIYTAFYLLLKYSVDGPMVVINDRNLKLFLNEGSCVLTFSKQYVFKHCTNTTGSTTVRHTLGFITVTSNKIYFI
jgi:hypothetical protein